MKVKLLKPIEGYEDVAEWRRPKKGESCLFDDTYPSGAPKLKVDILRHPFHCRLVLTKKKSLTESLGLEVGAVYFKNDTYVAVEVLPSDMAVSLDLNQRRPSEARKLEKFLFFTEGRSDWRKVINADGSMVDGDLEWVTVGGFEVPKVDFREIGSETCSLKSSCCCGWCTIPF